MLAGALSCRGAVLHKKYSYAYQSNRASETYLIAIIIKYLIINYTCLYEQEKLLENL